MLILNLIAYTMLIQVTVALELNYGHLLYTYMISSYRNNSEILNQELNKHVQQKIVRKSITSLDVKWASKTINIQYSNS